MEEIESISLINSDCLTALKDKSGVTTALRWSGFPHFRYRFIPTLPLRNAYGGATIPNAEIDTRIGSQLTLHTKEKKSKGDGYEKQ